MSKDNDTYNTKGESKIDSVTIKEENKPATMMENIFRAKEFANKSQAHIVCSINKFKQTYTDKSTKVLSFVRKGSSYSVDKLIDEKIHQPILTISSQINEKSPYLSSFARNHYYLFMGASTMTFWLPLSLMGRRAGIFGAMLGVSLSYSALELVNFKYNYPDGLKLCKAVCIKKEKDAEKNT